MKNQVYQGTPTSRRFALCPSSVEAGDPVLLGTQPAVALDNYQSNLGGTTFDTGGSFTLTVLAVSQISPAVGAAMKPGAAVYASGTLDSATNVTTDLVLSAVTSGTLFGQIDPSYTSGITSGTEDTAAIVRVKGIE